MYTGEGKSYSASHPRKRELNMVAETWVARAIEDYEARRRKKMPWFYAGFGVSVLVAIVVGIETGKILNSVVIFFFGLLFATRGLAALVHEFKEKVVRIILTEYGFSYDPKGASLDLKAYDSILPKYDKAAVGDHFWGTHDGVYMSLADLRLRRRASDSDSKVFRGQIGEFEFPKKVRSPICVKRGRGIIGRSAESMFGASDRVKLEDPVFEEEFDVYCKDQVEARYILTPTMMDRFTKLAQQFNGLQAVFEGDRVRLAFPRAPDLFHPGSVLVPINPDIGDRFIRDMRTIFDFVDALKLDAQTKS